MWKEGGSMLPEEVPIKRRTLRKRDVMDLLGISERTYKTYLEVGLLHPIPAPKQKRHTFSLPAIIKKFQLA
jgi:hypothetical protein